MSENFYTILTQIGKAKLANAYVLGEKVNLVTMVIGDGNGNYYNPAETQTSLVHEVWRGNLNSLALDNQNPNWITADAIIQSSEGGFMVREVGILDDVGDLVAIGKYPETYKPLLANGAAKDLHIKMILEISNSASVTLKLDPSIIIATKNDINTLNNSISSINSQLKDISKVFVNVQSPPSPLLKANGDGLTDDTSALNAILDYVQSLGGGVVFLPIGTYIINSLIVGSNVTVMGAGKGTVIKQKDNASNYACVFQNKNFSVGDTNIVFKDFVIDGNKANQTVGVNSHFGIYLGVVDGVAIDNVTVENMSADGIYAGYSWAWGNTIESPSRNIKICNCIVKDNARNNIAILYADTITIDNCYISGAASSALIDLENHHLNDYIKNITVKNCTIIRKDTGMPIQCITTYLSANDNIVFINNTLKTQISISNMNNVSVVNNKFSSIATNSCPIEIKGAKNIRVEGNAFDSGNIGVYAYPYLGTDSSNIQIFNNSIKGQTNQGIYLSNVINAIASGNIIVDNGKHGIYIEGTCTAVVIKDNIITDTRSSGKTQTYALFLHSTNIAIIIEGNYLIGNLTGVVDGTANFDLLKILWKNNKDNFLDGTSTANNIATTTFGYSMVWQNELILCNPGASMTMTIPSATICKGKIKTLKKIDPDTSKIVTVNSAGGTIDGATSVQLTTQYQVLRVISDGVNWYKIN